MSQILYRILIQILIYFLYLNREFMTNYSKYICSMSKLETCYF